MIRQRASVQATSRRGLQQCGSRQPAPPVWVPPESGTNLLQSAPRASKIFTTLPRFLLGVLFVLLLLREQLSRLFGAAAIAFRE